jgi:hypothetical protein
VSWEHFVDLCIRTYWLGVADNWGKAEGMENPLSFMAIVCITGSTVYHVFFFIICHYLSAELVNYLLEGAVVILDGAEVETGSRT